jgi:hypothetical protein
MIAFQDFAPGQMSQATSLVAGQWQPFDQAVVAANAWIQQYAIHVISVETLLLPNVWNTVARGTLESRLHTTGDMSNHWFQVVRVWFDPEQTGHVSRQPV